MGCELTTNPYGLMEKPSHLFRDKVALRARDYRRNQLFLLISTELSYYQLNSLT